MNSYNTKGNFLSDDTGLNFGKLVVSPSAWEPHSSYFKLNNCYALEPLSTNAGNWGETNQSPIQPVQCEVVQEKTRNLNKNEK